MCGCIRHASGRGCERAGERQAYRLASYESYHMSNRFNCILHQHCVSNYTLARRQTMKFKTTVENSPSEYTLNIGCKKNHITACGVLKTTPNIHPSHVGWDTSAQILDTSAVAPENSYWESIESSRPSSLDFYLLMLTPIYSPVLGPFQFLGRRRYGVTRLIHEY